MVSFVFTFLDAAQDFCVPGLIRSLCLDDKAEDVLVDLLFHLAKIDLENNGSTSVRLFRNNTTCTRVSFQCMYNAFVVFKLTFFGFL